MTGPATYAVAPTFLGVERRDRGAPICVAGIPFDLGTSNRSGTRFGPAAIRQASRMLVDGAHPFHWVDPAALPLADIGDFAIALGDIPASLARIEEAAGGIAHLVALGGDHGITLAAVAGARPAPRHRRRSIHFDAHVDTWPDTFGQRYGHGSVFYHAIEEGLVEPRRMIQIGIRSPMEREIHDWTIDARRHHRHRRGGPRDRPRRGRRAHPRHRGRRAGLSQLRYRRARSRLRARHRNAGDRRTGELAGAGDPAPPRRARLRRHSTSSRWRRPMISAEVTALAGATMAWEYLCLLGRNAAGA